MTSGIARTAVIATASCRPRQWAARLPGRCLSRARASFPAHRNDHAYQKLTTESEVPLRMSFVTDQYSSATNTAFRS